MLDALTDFCEPWKMSSFVPSKGHLREGLLLCFHLKKNAREAHETLVSAYGDHALGISQCKRWYKKFKSGNFDVENKTRENAPKKFEDAELQALLDEDDTQTQEELAEQLQVDRATVSRRLSGMGLIRKISRWVPHQLSDRNQERRLTTCELLLARHKQKSFLHRIITGDEKWILFDTPKRQKSWVKPGTASKTTVRPNRFGKKIMLCVWWDQDGIVYYELLKPGETVNTVRYKDQLMSLQRALDQKRPIWRERHNKLILLHDNAPSHTAATVKETIEGFQWESLPHPAYSPDLAPSDYHLFSSLERAEKPQHFENENHLQNWLQNFFDEKNTDFYRAGIRALPERWAKCVANNGNYFE
jgi:histone-lysine N-methyltransferase SETMAR